MLPTAPPATCRRSRSSTLQPARASSVAATSPFGPAPITTASTVTRSPFHNAPRPPPFRRAKGGGRRSAVGLVAVAVAAVAVAMTRVGLLLRRLLRDDRLGRQQHAGDGGGVADRGAGDLDRVDDPLLDQVAVLTGRRVESLTLAELAGPVDGDATLEARVRRDPVR